MQATQTVETGRFRLIIADDHRMVAESFARHLARHHRVVGVAFEARQLLELAQSVEADCLFLDLSMRDRNGLELVSLLKSSCRELKIVMVTMHNERVMADAALAAGADGFVPKDAGFEELLAAIPEVMAGRRYVSPKVPRASHGLGLEAAHLAFHRLTERQQQIVRLIGEGLSPLRVAEKLGLSPSTITLHKHSIMERLGVHSDDGLRRFAMLVWAAMREAESRRAKAPGPAAAASPRRLKSFQGSG